MIRADNVTVRLGGREVVRRVDLLVPTGEITAIVGPNGSGKSTLLRALVRAVRVQDGTVTVDGTDVRRRSRRWLAQRVTYVGQRPDGDPSLTVAEEVALGGLARRAPGRTLPTAVADALDEVELHARASARLETLSGGELQRVAIARALVQDADHVLLDEPTNHLDPRHRLDVLALATTVAPTVVVVLHDLDLAARFADRVVVLHHGEVVAAGPPEQVLVPAVIDPVYGVRSHVVPPPPDLPAAARHFAFTTAPPAAQPIAPPTAPPTTQPTPERTAS